MMVKHGVDVVRTAFKSRYIPAGTLEKLQNTACNQCLSAAAFRRGDQDPWYFHEPLPSKLMIQMGFCPVIM